MISHKQLQDISLKKVGEQETETLPRGIKLIMLGDKPIFVRRSGGHFMPVSNAEQEELYRKHIHAGR